MHLYGREDSVAKIALREKVSLQWVYRNRKPRPNPTFDADGYPDDQTLDEIRNWKIESNFSVKDLLSYVGDAWRYQFMISKGSYPRPFIRIATHGWSGNESLVSALMENHVFWSLCWRETRAGGGYKLITKPFKE